jgi:predicted nucleotidyltransferase
MARLTDMLGSKNCMALLMMLIARPEEEIYQADIVKRSNLSKMTVIKWLNFLEKHNVLKATKKGNLKYYSLNKDNPILKQIKALVNTMNVYEPSNRLSGKGVEVYLFGSAARGEDTGESDIDVLIIGKIDKRDLVAFIDNVRERTNKKVNPVVMDPFEYLALHKKNKTFYENFQKDRIRLI